MAVPKVDFIYKIVPSSPRVPVTSSGKLPMDYLLPVSDLDEKDGFMHMSTAIQVPKTLNLFFSTSVSDKASVYLFKVPYKPLADRGMVRWEDAAGVLDVEGSFPHIYDERKFKMSHEEVESVSEVVSETSEKDWDGAVDRLTKSGWLE